MLLILLLGSNENLGELVTAATEHGTPGGQSRREHSGRRVSLLSVQHAHSGGGGAACHLVGCVVRRHAEGRLTLT